jgi:hypothetical protein
MVFKMRKEAKEGMELNFGSGAFRIPELIFNYCEKYQPESFSKLTEKGNLGFIKN